ncbi:hypothetical protein [Streptomyces sp. AC558_RSS880]|uniref:hypothetical protein n=1 Tax=Streptomyces sp. AC558_RSS880 TaxID=2823687 RepID=UPI0020B7DABF|nr:hypothetical protein [Streptomyces sp. AC558_RSS880]
MVTTTADHSALFARLRADHQGAKPGRAYDPELLFPVWVLHDIGLTRAGDRHQRFEVDGADTAAEFLTAQGLPAATAFRPAVLGLDTGSPDGTSSTSPSEHHSAAPRTRTSCRPGTRRPPPSAP